MGNLISIIIPVYNSERSIKDTLNSVKGQTYKDWECLIVDDGSIDGTYSIIQDYLNNDERFKYFKRDIVSPKGANSCRQKGAEESQGKYLIFLDADDIITNSCLEKRLESIEKLDDIDLAVFHSALFKDDISVNELITLELENKNQYLISFFKYRIPYTISSCLWKRDYFLTINFDLKLSRFQDYDLNIRGLLNTERILFYPHSEIDFLYRESIFFSTISNHEKKIIWEDCLYLVDKYLKSNPEYKKYFFQFLFSISSFCSQIFDSKRIRGFRDIYKRIGNNKLSEYFLIFLSHKKMNVIGFRRIRFELSNFIFR